MIGSLFTIIKNNYSVIAISLAFIITIIYMIVKGTVDAKRVGNMAIASITLFPPIVMMLSIFDDELLKVLASDKTILFVSGFVLTLHIINDIKDKFSS